MFIKNDTLTFYDKIQSVLDDSHEVTRYGYLLNIAPVNVMIPDKFSFDRNLRTNINTYINNKILIEQATHCRKCRVIDWFTPEFMLNDKAHRDAVHLKGTAEGEAVLDALVNSMCDLERVLKERR